MPRAARLTAWLLDLITVPGLTTVPAAVHAITHCTHVRRYVTAHLPTVHHCSKPGDANDAVRWPLGCAGAPPCARGGSRSAMRTRRRCNNACRQIRPRQAASHTLKGNTGYIGLTYRRAAKQSTPPARHTRRLRLRSVKSGATESCNRFTLWIRTILCFWRACHSGARGPWLPVVRAQRGQPACSAPLEA